MTHYLILPRIQLVQLSKPFPDLLEKIIISPEGFSLEIALDKNITLKKMVKPSEMKFD